MASSTGPHLLAGRNNGSAKLADPTVVRVCICVPVPILDVPDPTEWRVADPAIPGSLSMVHFDQASPCPPQLQAIFLQKLAYATAPHVGSINVQRSQSRLSGSQPCVITGVFLRSFPVRRGGRACEMQLQCTAVILMH